MTVSWNAGTQTLTYWVDGKKGGAITGDLGRSVFWRIRLRAFWLHRRNGRGQNQQLAASQGDERHCDLCAGGCAHPDRHRPSRWNRADKWNRRIRRRQASFHPHANRRLEDRRRDGRRPSSICNPTSIFHSTSSSEIPTADRPEQLSFCTPIRMGRTRWAAVAPGLAPKE